MYVILCLQQIFVMPLWQKEITFKMVNNIFVKKQLLIIINNIHF